MALPKAPAKTATQKRQLKMRGNRKSIEDIHMGPEPIFFDKEISEEEYTTVWSKAASWYNYFYSSKDYQPAILQYAVEALGYTVDEANTLKKLSDWELKSDIGAVCKLWTRGLQPTDDYAKRVAASFVEKIAKAKKIVLEAKAIQKAKPVLPTIQERMRTKMYETVYSDWDNIIDGWIDGNYDQSIDTYALFKGYNLKGATMTMFGDLVRFEYESISDAYHKTCDQAIEAYSHIKKSDLKKMLNLMDGIFSDLERLKQSAKSSRLPRAKKVKASDQQVKKLNYLVEDIDSKLVSINPVMIPTNNRLFVYNVKTRKLSMYISDTEKGFEVKGSTVYNWNEEFSKITTLRKPDEILPQILSRTERQIDNLWDTFTTKIGVPNGRINKDCILVRVSNK